MYSVTVFAVVVVGWAAAVMREWSSASSGSSHTHTHTHWPCHVTQGSTNAL